MKGRLQTVMPETNDSGSERSRMIGTLLVLGSVSGLAVVVWSMILMLDL